jgi:hypothetical protein
MDHLYHGKLLVIPRKFLEYDHMLGPVGTITSMLMPCFSPKLPGRLGRTGQNSPLRASAKSTATSRSTVSLGELLSGDGLKLKTDSKCWELLVTVTGLNGCSMMFIPKYRYIYIYISDIWYIIIYLFYIILQQLATHSWESAPSKAARDQQGAEANSHCSGPTSSTATPLRRSKKCLPPIWWFKAGIPSGSRRTQGFNGI